MYNNLKYYKVKNFGIISKYFGSEVLDTINYSDGWIEVKFNNSDLKVTIFTIGNHLKVVNSNDPDTYGDCTLIGVNTEIPVGNSWKDEFNQLIESSKFGLSWNSYKTCIDALVEMWENNYASKSWYEDHMFQIVCEASGTFSKEVKFDPIEKEEMTQISYSHFPDERFPEVLSTGWGDRFTDLKFNVRDFDRIDSTHEFNVDMS